MSVPASKEYGNIDKGQSVSDSFTHFSFSHRTLTPIIIHVRNINPMHIPNFQYEDAFKAINELKSINCWTRSNTQIPALGKRD